MALLPGAGPDLRLLCGYVSARRRTVGNAWYERWVSSQFERDPKPLPLLFEVAWRCGATEFMARGVAELLRSEQVSQQLVSQLGFGSWDENLPADVLETVLRAMSETGHRAAAIGILANRMKLNSVEAGRWKPLALELATASDLIRSGHMTSYYWNEVAKTLVTEHAGEIAAAIIREQVDRGAGAWFAEHSEAAGVLRSAWSQDPTRSLAGDEAVPIVAASRLLVNYRIPGRRTGTCAAGRSWLHGSQKSPRSARQSWRG